MLLTPKEQGEYLLKTGKIFEHVCDTPGCGKLIRAGELCTVLKWGKRPDGLIILGQIPLKVRCSQCEEELHPRKEIVKVKGAGRGAKKVSAEVAQELTVDINVRKFVMSQLKKTPEGIEPKILVQRMARKKALRVLKKGVILKTIRSMRKLKLIKKKGGKFVLVVSKKKRQRKEKVNA